MNAFNNDFNSDFATGKPLSIEEMKVSVFELQKQITTINADDETNKIVSSLIDLNSHMVFMLEKLDEDIKDIPLRTRTIAVSKSRRRG